MPKLIPDDVKQEALQLRIEGRLGLKEICRRTGISRGTASLLLRDHPLTPEEIADRRAYRTGRKYVPEASRLAQLVDRRSLSREQKGHIAEAAVLLRLALQGFVTWRSLYDGNSVDWLISRPRHRRHLRIQVKWARRGRQGRPFFPVLRRNSKKMVNIQEDDCDYVIGYDLETDTAFVFPVRVIQGKARQSCDPEYAEAWHLILI